METNEVILAPGDRAALRALHDCTVIRAWRNDLRYTSLRMKGLARDREATTPEFGEEGHDLAAAQGAKLDYLLTNAGRERARREFKR